MEKGSKRKTRSDKKREIKPTLQQKYFELIHQLSYVSDQPLKVVGEEICMRGICSQDVIEYLSQYFVRDYSFSKYSFYLGTFDRDSYVLPKGEKRRITLRFHRDFYEKIAKLAFSMDKTISSTTALLIETAIQNTCVVNDYLTEYIETNLDPQRTKTLKAFIRFINKNSPFSDVEITLSSVIAYYVEELMDQTKDFKESINDWIDNLKDE